ncbi:MAG: 50S ribosomal protein L17 [Bacteroidales bacterium]|jgi:large subunit ribosomal protein L17|nr:50S ribosomal protein L17 [Bacteroidales bacterium]MDD4292885.1 50S ribosomal protein L17 [Bacteroidales bacterium]MDD4492043.1 50S ribosomal protein L17 [Bacteroidales bacterium]HNW48204.1 50S ribosomal protein L17 [Bacteroidales bacterium]HPS95470.1 50S ribosomal protein L17 [Bacteroidales bacterium]
MRHNKKFNHLGRKSGHRKAMLANMASSLILHKRIETTLAKAKALRVYVEPLITKSKDDTTHSRRTVFSYLKQKEAITELFRVIAPKIADRPGGYTRVLKLGFRQGDAADMAMIELVDFNEVMISGAKAEVKKAATRRSGVKKATDAAESGEPKAPKAPKAKAEPKAKAVAPKAKTAAPKAKAAAKPTTQRKTQGK